MAPKKGSAAKAPLAPASDDAIDTVHMYKFPRTPHLLSLGAAATDDIVMANADALAFLAHGPVILEEKVDGANLGISFETLDGPPRCQKRGRWITPDSEGQFAKLQAWLENHTEALRRVLGTRYVLYGEWCAARHSVPYDALPDWLLAYDVLDTQEGKFMSCARRDAFLRPTGLPIVPSVVPSPGRAFAGPAGLEQLRETVLGLRSALCVRVDGAGAGAEHAQQAGGTLAEGVYVRQEDVEGRWLVRRAKVVHPAFIQMIVGEDGPNGGAHWSKRNTVWNRVRPDLWRRQQQQQGEGEGEGEGEEEAHDEEGEQPQGEAQEAAPSSAAVAPGTPRAAAAGPAAGTAPSPAAPVVECPPTPTLTVATGPTATDAAATAASGAAAAGPPGSGPVSPAAYQAAEEAAFEEVTRLRAVHPPHAAAAVMCVCGGLYVSLAGAAVDAAAAWALERGAVPNNYVANRRARDGPDGHHHVTLVTPPEMEQLRAQRGLGPHQVLAALLKELGPHGTAGWAPLGVGRARSAPSGDHALYLVVCWPAGHAARRALGLTAVQHFHITLGFDRADVHDRPKGLSTLMGGELDPKAVLGLAEATAAAGLQLPGAGCVAVLAAQALVELSAPIPTPAAATGTPPSEPLSPHVVEMVRALLLAALQVAQGRTVQRAAWPAAVATACAHVALARLAGRYGELDELDEHVRKAEQLVARHVQDVREAGLALAAALVLRGKACVQRGEHAGAAAAFARAEECLSRYDAAHDGAGAPQQPQVGPAEGAGSAAQHVHHLLALVRQSGGELLRDAPALARAAAACSRKANAGRGTAHRAAPAPAPAPTPTAVPAPCVEVEAGDGGCAAAAECYAAVGGVPSGYEAGPLNPRERSVVRIPQAAAGPAAAAAGASGWGGAEVTLMRNTSWVVPGVLMGSSTPKSPEQIVALQTLGVGLVVTLTEETPLPPAWFAPPPQHPAGGAAAAAAARGGVAVRNLFVPVPNYEPPSLQQMDAALAAMEQHLAAGGAQQLCGVLVHCGGGKGRAGTVLACYLCKHGLSAPAPPPTPPTPPAPAGAAEAAVHAAPAMGADAAVRLIREMRPGSIETEQQRRFVGAYADELWRRYDAHQRQLAQQPKQAQQDGEEEGGSGHGSGAGGERRGGGSAGGAAGGRGGPGAVGAAGPSAGQGAGQRRHAQQAQQAQHAQHTAAPAGTCPSPARGPPSAARGGAAEDGAEAREAGADGSEAAAAHAGPASGPLPGGGSYPSTPHLPFSPQVAADDAILDTAHCSQLLNVPLVVTEKLDGGNCCIAAAPHAAASSSSSSSGCFPGSNPPLVVYARTHKHPATHASFGPVKQLVAERLQGRLPAHIALFGENLTAVHSIRYARVPSHFFLFGVWDGAAQRWCSWDEVEGWAARLGLHTAPVVHTGAVSSLTELEALLTSLMRQPSSLDGTSPREGFVVRTAAAVPPAEFDRCVAKYVRQGHVQTEDSWRRTWQRSAVVPEPPPEPSMQWQERVGQVAQEAQQPEAMQDDQQQQQAPRQQQQQQHAQGGRREQQAAAPAGPPAPAPALEQTAGRQQSQGSSAGAAAGATGDRAGPSAAVGAGTDAAASAGAGAGVGGRAAPSAGAGPGAGGGSSSSRTPAGRPAGPPPRNLPQLVMLVGLPGSGKSSFAQALEATGWWTRVCQDECGSRGAAEAAFGVAMLRGSGAGRHVVLDRCNPDVADRKEWLALGLVGKRDKGIVAVHFDVDAPTCRARVAARTDHPTIPQGRGGRIVDSFAARLQPPTAAEGFERIYTLRSRAEADALLAAWGAGPMQVDPPPAAPPPPPHMCGWEEYERMYGGGEEEEPGAGA